MKISIVFRSIENQEHWSVLILEIGGLFRIACPSPELLITQSKNGLYNLLYKEKKTYCHAQNLRNHLSLFPYILFKEWILKLIKAEITKPNTLYCGAKNSRSISMLNYIYIYIYIYFLFTVFYIRFRKLIGIKGKMI